MEYEEPKKCAICGAELRFVPAGVSKRTGKPYTAFWSCPNGCKSNSYKPPINTGSIILVDRVAALEEDVKEIKEDIKKIKDAIRKRWGIEAQG